jgi:hypothetical protein
MTTHTTPGPDDVAQTNPNRIPRDKLIPAAERALLEQIETVAADMLNTLGEFSVTTAVEYEQAVSLLRTVKTTAKKVEELRTALSKPLYNLMRAVNAEFDPAKASLELAERRLKSMSAAYTNAQRAEQQRLVQEAQQKAAEARRLADAITTAGPGVATPGAVAALADASREAQTLLSAAAAAAPDTPGVTYREEMEWRVVDLSVVPREYLMVDPAKVREALKSGVTAIPGLSVFPITKVTVRGS